MENNRRVRANIFYTCDQIVTMRKKRDVQTYQASVSYKATLSAPLIESSRSYSGY